MKGVGWRRFPQKFGVETWFALLKPGSVGPGRRGYSVKLEDY